MYSSVVLLLSTVPVYIFIGMFVHTSAVSFLRNDEIVSLGEMAILSYVAVNHITIFSYSPFVR